MFDRLHQSCADTGRRRGKQLWNCMVIARPHGEVHIGADLLGSVSCGAEEAIGKPRLIERPNNRPPELATTLVRSVGVARLVAGAFRGHDRTEWVIRIR